MKIIFVVNELSFFLRTHLNLANSMSKTHKIGVITDISKSSKEDLEFLKNKGIELYRLNRKKSSFTFFSYIKHLITLLKLLRKINPKYVFYVTLEMSFFGSLISYFLSIKKSIFIITGLGPFFFRKEFKYKFFHKLQYYFFRLLNYMKDDFLFIFLNLADKKLIQNLYKIKDTNCQLIYGEGIIESEFRNIKRDISIPRFLLASRLVKSKGIETFVNVAKRIKSESPSVQFSIAGIYDLNNPESISQNLYEEIRNNNSINFLGEVAHEQMEKYFHQNNVFVLPSQREGLPKAAAEAAMTGMPLILSNVPGCRDCVEQNVNGMLVSYMNEDELYQAMKRFIDDTKLIYLMGEQSSILANKKFSFQSIHKQFSYIIS